MLRLAFIVVSLVLTIVPNSHAQTPDETRSTLWRRLSTTKNVGLAVEEKIGGYVLVVYNNDQDTKNREILKKHEEEWGDRYARIQRYQKKIEKAMDDGKYEASESLKKESHREEPDPFDGVKLCRVVYVSSEYIELEELYRPDGTIVIPLHKLARVKFPRNPEASK